MKEIKPEFETFARIKVVGIGGSGNHAISRMVEAGLSGVEFVAVNTDAQDLHHCKASEKIHIGKNLTRGLGAGMNPDVGRQAAEENKDEIQDALKNTDMVFITCGLGGGTGTGAAPIIAEAAREAGALTVAVVTKPFIFEGIQRKKIANEGLENLMSQVDTIITIPNDKILQVINEKTLLLESFKIADDILRQGVQGISDLITTPGIVNVDFADVKAIMQDKGSSLMGIGSASGESRAVDAAKRAINSPLLEMSIDGAKGVLFNVSGGSDLTMMEVNEAAGVITELIDEDAKVIFGSIIDENLKKGEVKITVIATGFSEENNITQRSDKIEANSSSFNTLSKDTDINKGVRKDLFKEDNNLGYNNINDSVEDVEKEEEKEEEKEKEEEEVLFTSSINPVEPADEYDVPAFIRKKLNKGK
ncbi:MAG: cell division protein FtsZ [Candidatus Pacebacteria bacterium]|nr:cell division protein FtsZ [Candidatus Paceibacterota bacterium]